MKIAVQLLVVTEAFLDQMAPVRRRIDQDIVRLLLQSALDYRFQILVFDLKLLKGKIIHVNNKFIIAVLNLRDDLIQILKLMLVDLDDAQSAVIVPVQDCLDARRLAGTGIAKQQTVIRAAPLYERLCIINQLLFLNLIADEILQLYMRDIRDRLDLHIVSDMRHTERLVQAQLSYTEFLIERYHILCECLECLCIRQLITQLTDPVTDAAVEQLPRRFCTCIMQKFFKHSGLQHALQLRKIAGKQLAEDRKIMSRQTKQTPLCHAADLTGRAENIFIIHKQKCQIIMPQIVLKAIISCQLNQVMHTGKEAIPYLTDLLLFLQMLQNPCHIQKDLAIFQIPV